MLDEKGQKVVSALENPTWDWRTIGGISEETGIEPSQVSSILKALPNVVQTTDKSGGPLFTTRNHYDKRQNIANRILSAFSDRIR